MALGENCRSGCRTRDHASWGECAKAANLRVGWAAHASGLDKTADKAFESELDAYREARAQGIQPAGTTRRAIEEAKRVSDSLGSAYNAESMPPTKLLDKPAVISAAKEAGQL